MVEFLVAVIAFSIAIIFLFQYLSSRASYENGRLASFHTLIFCFWIIAMVMWPRAFFVYHVAGVVDLTIARAVFVILAISSICGFLFTPSPRAGSYTVGLLLFLFSVICLVSMSIHGFRRVPPFQISPWFVFITAYLFPFAAFVFAKKYLTDQADLSAVFHTLFYIGVYLSIIAFFEFFHLKQYVFPQFINNPKVWLHINRARGPFLNAAINGFAIVIGFICGVQILSSKRGFGRVLHLAMMSLFFPAVFFTLTRSIYLCFLFTLTGLLIAYRTAFPKRMFALPLLLVLVFVLINMSRFESTNRRTGGIYEVTEVKIRESLLKRSVEMIGDNPVFGVGLGQFMPASVAKYKGIYPVAESSEQQAQHFQFIGLMVELGLVGALAYLAILAAFFHRFRTLLRSIPDIGFISPNLVLLLGLGMGVFLLNNCFLDASFHLFPNVLFFTFGGVMDGLYGQLNLMEGLEPLTAMGL